MSSGEPIIFENETGAQRAFGYVNHVYPDRTETHLDIDDRHTNRHGTLHGGLIAALLDSACGFAASRAWSDDALTRVLTLSFSTSFLAPAERGHVVAVARIRKLGRSIAYSDGEVFDEDGTLVATGTGVFKRIRDGSGSETAS